MKKVYINCPYNNEYQEYLNPILFTLIYCGHNAVMCENPSSGGSRVDHICSVIKSTQFSIHDLSGFFDHSDVNQLIPKFNMPLELGLDLGYINFSKNIVKKKILVCVKDRETFNKSLSDLGGHDIAQYNDNVDDLIGEIRNWLYKISGNKKILSASQLQQKYSDFKEDYINIHLKKSRSQSDIDKLPKVELIHDISDWVQTNKYIT